MLELLWPTECAGCGVRDAGRLCPACLPSGPLRLPVHPEGVSGVLALADYEGGLARALRRAKYGRDRALAVALARGMAASLAPTLVRGPPEIVVPAPSPWTRRLARGFSVPHLLAHHLGRALDRPVVDVLRLRPGPRQARLGRRRRAAALAGRLRATHPMRAASALLVDDVLTTGSTAAAAARELLGSGVGEVWLAVLCAAGPSPRSETNVQNL